MIRVCYFKTSDIEISQVANEILMLPANLQKQVLRFYQEKDRVLRLGGYLILKHFLEREGSGLTLSNIERDKNNKPYISNWNYFNTSYSGNYTILAFHDRPIGIDIEKITPLEDYEGIYRHFHEEEKEKISSSPNPVTEFYTIWVKKEASLKAMGIGIVNGMNQFSCIKDDFIFNDSTWYFTRVLNQPDYLSYICSTTKGEIHIISYKELVNLN